MVAPVLEVSLSREYMLILRDGLLKQVDAIERMLSISPRTSELRRELKALNPPPQYQVELEHEKKEVTNGNDA